VALRIGSSIVQNLLGVVVAVYLDQILHRKEFPGFGLFLKVPPGFQEHQAYFKSYVLSHTMSELSNTLRMQEQLLKEPKVITNVARYVAFMSEAIFEGWFLNGAAQLLDFVGQVLEFLQRRDVSLLKNVRLCSQAINSMKRAFLRISLLQLSELDEVKDPKPTAAFLEKLAYWQTVILSSDSEDQYFLRLIFFLLYLRIISNVSSVRGAAIDFWRMLLVQKPDEAQHVLNHAAPAGQRFLASGFMKLAELDNEAFLVWIDHHRKELDSLFLGSLTRHWEDFVAEENKRTDETAQARTSRRRERLKAWQEEEMIIENHWRKHESATGHWRNNVHAAERLKHQRAMQDQQDNLSFTATSLEKFDRVLKGPVSLFEADSKMKWRLDESEGQNRMRLRLIPDRSLIGDEYQPKRKTSEQMPKRSSSVSIRGNSSNATPQPLFHEPGTMGPGRSRADSRASRMSEAGEEEFEFVDNPRTDEGGDFEDKNRKVMRTLQRGDVVQQVFNIARIEGLEALEGLLIVGKQCLYLIDHYFQRADGEVVGVWQAPAEERDPYLQLISGRETKVGRPKVAPGERTTRHWRWGDVMLVSKRRFLLRDVALEVFFTDGRSYLLTAISADVRNILHTILIARSPMLNNPTASLHPEDQWRVEALRNPEDIPQSFGSKFASVFNTAASTPATRKWVKGEISNFAYLMQINTMAGRTFNDLTQYPVFPWVLADYTSEELDMTDPHTFRDFSKPMGCQHPSREAEFRERYANVAEMTSDPPYHYGTHYSSAMTVSSYLIRLEPFVKSYLLLQGGSFDHADRLFYSIEKAWLSASRDNMSDVRELTPEFFYLPEFLVNSNEYNFGVTQGTGQTIGNVLLPPWAKGDPHVFIQKHREALESPYVSAHLHKWIDLVFGFKQQGEAAIEATNVFHHLSYQGAKDLDTIADPTERMASIGIIHNFGQTPRQVFMRQHPTRDENTGDRSKDLNHILDTLARSHTPVFDRNESVSGLIWSVKTERVIPQGPFSLHVPPAFEIIMRWGYADGSVRFFSFDGKRSLGLYENFHLGPVAAAVFVDGQTLVTAGQDGVVTVWNINMVTSTSATGQGRISAVDVNQRDSLFGHSWPVTLLSASKSLSTLLSADTSGRILLWDLNRNQFIRELHPGSHTTGSLLKNSRSPEQQLTSPKSGNLSHSKLRIESTSLSRKSTNSGDRRTTQRSDQISKSKSYPDDQLISQRVPPMSKNPSAAQQHISKLTVHNISNEISSARISAATGDIAFCTHRSLYIYTLNGALLLKHDVCDDLDPADRVTACAWYEGLRGDWVSRILILTGHRNGAVRVWHRIVDAASGKYVLECLRRLPPAGQQHIRDNSYAREGLRHGQQMMRPGHVPPASLLGQQPRATPRLAVERGASVTSILPRAEGVWVGDESGRVVSTMISC
jgi:hypothetical protein